MLHPLVRIAEAIENIAGNIEKLANPMLFCQGVQVGGNTVGRIDSRDFSNKPKEMFGTITEL
jgi:hypothetical protein